jgi:hypothetical protein
MRFPTRNGMGFLFRFRCSPVWNRNRRVLLIPHGDRTLLTVASKALELGHACSFDLSVSSAVGASIIGNFAATPAMIPKGNLITFCAACHRTAHIPRGHTFGSEFRPAPDSWLAADFAPGFDGAKNSDYIRCNESVSRLCRTPWVAFNQTNLSLRSRRRLIKRAQEPCRRSE